MRGTGALARGSSSGLDSRASDRGGVTEWPIVLAWKASVPKGTGGSNPPPSAIPFWILDWRFWIGRENAKDELRWRAVTANCRAARAASKIQDRLSTRLPFPLTLDFKRFPALPAFPLSPAFVYSE
jgi:hypothetical protein